MRTTFTRATLLVLGLSVLAVAESKAQYSRKTPIVEAVQKTRDGIVTIKVEKHNGATRKDVVGTGVIVDSRGYLITNRHVVVGADRIVVHLADGTQLTAKVELEDARHDLAVLKVTPTKKLTELSFGPSADLMVGETVIAIGHPFGYTNTVSTGIISAVGREVTMPNGDSLTNLIQTNASINPGNSGGPMLNINGELIGINVALREGAQGIAFALNADSVQQALAGHLSAARVAGVNHGCTCSETVREEGVARQQVVLDRVQRDGPGDLAGLRRGDVLIRVGGRPIANRFDLERAFWNARTGDKVELRVIRDGREMRATLTLDAAEGVDVARGGSSAVRPVAAEEDSRTPRPRR